MSRVYRFQDGSRLEILEEGKIKRDFPLSLDLKITNSCHHSCPWCHESSEPLGEHAGVSEILDHLKGLPKGTEIAIGGGNPLCHPGLQDIIDGLGRYGYVVNMTVRDIDLQGIKDIHGVSAWGISISEDGPKVSMLAPPPNSVAHLILGVTSAETYWEVKKIFPRVLWLGYKSWGRGERFKPGSIMEISREITKDLYQGQGILAFDNLAITQLDLRSKFLKKEWELMYLGPEFTSSMYVDAVKGEYSESSTSPGRVSWKEISLINYYRNATNNTNPI